MLLFLQLILCPGFPSFFLCHLPGLFIQSFPLILAVELGDPSNTVTASRPGWQHIQKWKFSSSPCSISSACLGSLREEISGGDTFWKTRSCVRLAKSPPSMSPIDPHQLETGVISRGADPQLPEQSLALVSSKAPCEPSLGMKCDFC